MKTRATLFTLSICLVTLFTACQDKKESQIAVTDNFSQVYQNINTEDLKRHIKTLASDEFEGRLPTTIGEEKTLDYLTKEFTQLGFQPGNGDRFLQPVELVEMTADPNMVMTIGDNTFVYKEHMMASTKREQKQIELKDSELVFVGYGVNAPEYGWNDYADLDVKGKTVVILVNDPGFENPESGLFQGKTMTYYGRWTYKYEEASRQGAAAALIVHETKPASYGWSVVANSWSGAQYGLVTENGNADKVAVEGWLTLESATKIFADVGLDFQAEKQNAMLANYHKTIGLKASVTINNSFKKSTSYNFVATLPGTTAADEHLIYTAHWDHLGKDENIEGDQIYNGAHDNATGVASSLAVAKAYSQLNIKPKRSATFLIVTAEEQGLLGSKYYTEHPIIPLEKTVANINMDAMNVLGRTKDVAVVGMGKSELESYLTKAAKAQKRYLVQESKPEAGYYYRSDHFNFAKKGVPALYAKGGTEPIDAATADYRKRTNVIITGCYHQVCDQYREKWDLSGIQEDAQLLFEVGYDIVNSNEWPKWAETSEFQRIK
ncbi:M20/M25/M40 family metallo-hydrolase [Paraglaciecola aquimarina]|uniref:M20/M25/M40 family metallo-hydrolase n=1 Tax=Paraglaciecola algarum TaxID=3050085 RepID=A0ABS9D6Y9_9ALTE|nr:M28 family metallopeptidase [Paraglaciecola sp. G1-23]MCF2948182.1 M20/M25/M40 family metallo-hydrolase [Paraglaciecola sp. G1-23]